MKNAVLTVALMAAAGVASAQPALLSNARVEVQDVAGRLLPAFDARVEATTGAGWMAYAVPIARGDRLVCDWDSRQPPPQPTSVKLEGCTSLYVFFRVEARAVERIRMFSEGCAIDAGGLPVVWFSGVAPEASVRLLQRYLAGEVGRRVANGALAALAMHETGEATSALVTAARQGATPQLRGQALFWTAQRAGDRAVPTITEAIERDPDTDVKKRAVFALSQLPADEGVPRLIEVAEHHSNPAVRRQAMFWLGQSRDPRALVFFERILLK